MPGSGSSPSAAPYHRPLADVTEGRAAMNKARLVSPLPLPMLGGGWQRGSTRPGRRRDAEPPRKNKAEHGVTLYTPDPSMSANGYRFIGLGLYTVPEASRLSHVSVGRIRRWLRGYTFTTRTGMHKSPPVVTSELPALE